MPSWADLHAPKSKRKSHIFSQELSNYDSLYEPSHPTSHRLVVDENHHYLLYFNTTTSNLETTVGCNTQLVSCLGNVRNSQVLCFLPQEVFQLKRNH